jgi:hypothetical protein
MAWLTSVLSVVNDIQSFLSDMYLAFDIDLAIGPQLDALGVILNTPRNLPFQTAGGISPIMDDGTYRIVLKAAVAVTHFDGTILSLTAILATAFSSSSLYFSIQDNQDMTASIIVFGPASLLLQDCFAHDLIIPRPEGVHLIVTYSANKAFSWNEETEYFGGWKEGYWV